MIAFFTLLIGGSMTYVFLQQRSRRIAREIAVERIFQEHLGRLRLAPSHVALLETLAGFLDKTRHKHQLIEDEITFTACARRALAASAAKSDEISALRIALGFKRPADRAPHSSTQLQPGTTVFLVRGRRTPPVRGRVLAQGARGFRVELQSGRGQFPSAGSVAVYYHSAAGVFRINSMILSLHGAVVELRHSEVLTRTQQRRHFRRRLKLPVWVRPLADTPNARGDAEAAHGSAAGAASRPAGERRAEAGGASAAETPAYAEAEETRVRAVGGGGASIENPNERYRPGDRLELRFATDGGRTPLLATARVVRCSEGDTVAHLEFTSIHEFVRDRIYRLLFSRVQ